MLKNELNKNAFQDKEEPKKCVIGGDIHDDNDDPDEILCPVCEKLLGYKRCNYEKANYCSNCGQKLSWEGL